MDRPTPGWHWGVSPRGVGAACQAVADHLAAEGPLQPSVWLERGGDLQCAACAGAAEDQPEAGARQPDVVRTAFAAIRRCTG